MPSARVLIKHGDNTYRLFRFETTADGSLLVFLDREPRSGRGSMVMNDQGEFIPEIDISDRPLPSAKFSIHTTGEVHRYSKGERKGTIYIDPLYRLTRRHLVGIVSIPYPSRLDLLRNANHDLAVSLEIPEEISERITFALEIGPRPQQSQTYGVALDYELYSAVVRVVQLPFRLKTELTEHFIHAMPTAGSFQMRQIDKGNAEIAFHRAIHGDELGIFRESGGAYVLLAAVPMRMRPALSVAFNRPDLRAEQIDFDYNSQPTHKVRFWICDKAGRNKVVDLREHITQITLDAEI